MCNNDEQSVIYTHSKIANTGHHSCMFSVVYNNIQKITNISIKKPIILISILNKYLYIPIYLDNCTPLSKTKAFFIFMAFLWSVSNIYLVAKHWNSFSYWVSCYLSVWNLLYWWCIFIVLNLIGDHIFLHPEPQNSIVYHQTLVQGLGRWLGLTPTHFIK